MGLWPVVNICSPLEEWGVHSGGFLFIIPQPTWGHVYGFTNTPLYIGLSSLVCNSILQPNLLYVVHFTYVGNSCHFLFVTPKGSFVQTQLVQLVEVKKSTERASLINLLRRP